MIEQISECKSCFNLLKILKHQEIYFAAHDPSYHTFFIGNHDNDVLVTVDFTYGSIRVDAVIRVFNGENYDLHQQTKVYLNKRGYFKLRDFLKTIKQ